MKICTAVLAILLMAFYPTTNAQPYRGGSNYNWFHIEGCQREPYGVLSNYHLFRNEVDAQLKQMASGGQQRLRIGVFHARNANTGTVIPSNGGNLPLQQRENLRDLMISAKNAGFIEVVVGFFPQLDNGPGSWVGATWNSAHEEYFQENWNLIANLMPYMRESKIKFLVDLMNEGSHHPPPHTCGENIQKKCGPTSLTFLAAQKRSASQYQQTAPIESNSSLNYMDLCHRMCLISTCMEMKKHS